MADDFTIRFTSDPLIPWVLKWRGTLLGAFTSEADALLFQTALERIGGTAFVNPAARNEGAQ